jgi:uncharacterized protein HemX
MPRERPSQVRRPLEPLDEPPPPATRAPRRAPAAPPPGQRSGAGAGKWVALLVVLALAAGGFAGYQALQDSDSNGVQLKEDVKGQVNEAVDSLKDLINDNTAN